MVRHSLLLATFALVLATSPAASAHPACIQAYPWSEVCALVDDVVPPGEACLPSPVAACQLPLDEAPVCVQALPWSLVCDVLARVGGLGPA